MGEKKSSFNKRKDKKDEDKRVIWSSRTDKNIFKDLPDYSDFVKLIIYNEWLSKDLKVVLWPNTNIIL